ncbi:hypothetical protein [Catenuloplanes japonicus]|uniref:hypothetical protein n=1 Tax=Catenuloplanes japonicus TaxID=33876 RepID=UPI0005253942|nr:hypothetical protein [Catenuloplanes japonicus]
MFLIAVIAVYGYIIVLSLWAMRVQLAAARTRHHPHDHPAASHLFERNSHAAVAAWLTGSLAVRLLQLLVPVPLWLLVPLTILAALLTLPIAHFVWRMAREDLHNWYIGGLNRFKTAILATCAAIVFLDQPWRVITLFWF